jgi:hypothetical protein
MSKLYCNNDPCETEAVWFYITDDGLPFCLCHTCSEAFNLGTVNPDACLYEVGDMDEYLDEEGTDE